MKYYADKVEDLFCQIKKGNSYVELQNVVSFSIPEISPESNELNGAGMIGPIEIPNPCNIGSMESSVVVSDDSGDAALLNDLYNVEVILNWAVDKVGTDGCKDYIAHRAVIKGKAMGNPGLKPSFTNNLMMFYNNYIQKHQRAVMANVFFTTTSNAVSRMVTYNPETGGQTSRPENRLVVAEGEGVGWTGSLRLVDANSHIENG